MSNLSIAHKNIGNDPSSIKKIVTQLLRSYKVGNPHSRIRDIIKRARELGFDDPDYKVIEKSMNSQNEL